MNQRDRLTLNLLNEYLPDLLDMAEREREHQDNQVNKSTRKPITMSEARKFARDSRDRRQEIAGIYPELQPYV